MSKRIFAREHKVVWNLARNLTMNLVINTLESLKNNNSMSSLKEILIHSEKGSNGN